MTHWYGDCPHTTGFCLTCSRAKEQEVLAQEAADRAKELAAKKECKVLRAKGHKLTMEWSGEYGVESSSTGTCSCGFWEESASSQREVQWEYKCHLAKVLGMKWSPERRRWIPEEPGR